VTSTTGEGATSTTAADTDVDGSEGSDTSGTAMDDTSSGGDDDPVGACESPQMCTSPSPYDGPGACDPYAQDCPDGQKCMPVIMRDTWDSTACRPLHDDPVKLGDPCTTLGGIGSGIDDCDQGSMCWAVDMMGAGTCVPLCGCGPAMPTCPSADLLCTQANGGALPLCLPSCDPVLQDCPTRGDGCYPSQSTPGFTCAPDAASTPTSPGDTCESLNACSAGQICVGPDFVPGCESPVGCCAEICDVGDASPCASMAVDCVPWWDGAAPEGCPASVGACGTVR
jgi:hypothetical protein